MVACNWATAVKAQEKYKHLNRGPDFQVVVGPADSSLVERFIACSIDRSLELCLRTLAPNGPYTVWVIRHAKDGGMAFQSLKAHLRRR